VFGAGLDLNVARSIPGSSNRIVGVADEHWQARVCTGHAHLPLNTFRRCVTRYDEERKVKHFTCLDQYLRMSFAQLTYRESLRDIVAYLRSQATKLYHMGFRSTVARNTLAN